MARWVTEKTIEDFLREHQDRSVVDCARSLKIKPSRAYSIAARLGIHWEWSRRLADQVRALLVVRTMTYKDIARVLHVSESRVKCIASRSGVLRYFSRKHPAGLDEAILADLRDGRFWYKEIAKRHHTTMVVVERIANKNGICRTGWEIPHSPPGRPTLPPASVAQAVALVADRSLSYSRISAMTGVSPAHIAYLAKRHGLLRGRGTQPHAALEK
jgi:uncharacterized protein YdbL (DUF1318 family)